MTIRVYRLATAVPVVGYARSCYDEWALRCAAATPELFRLPGLRK